MGTGALDNFEGSKNDIILGTYLVGTFVVARLAIYAAAQIYDGLALMPGNNPFVDIFRDANPELSDTLSFAYDAGAIAGIAFGLAFIGQGTVGVIKHWNNRDI